VCEGKNVRERERGGEREKKKREREKGREEKKRREKRRERACVRVNVFRHTCRVGKFDILRLCVPLLNFDCAIGSHCL